MSQTVQIKTGLIHKGSYGSAYDADTNTVKEVKVSTGKRGRPAKEPAPVFFNTNDLFGRVPLKAPKGTTGRVIKGVASE